MNLSDLVHRSTNGHHDHPMDSFYVPTTMHQQKAQDPSSSSSSSNTVVEAAAAAAAATGHPFLYDSAVYPSSQNLEGLPDTEQHFSPTHPSQLQHRLYFDPSTTSLHTATAQQNATTTTTTSPSESKRESPSPLNQFYLSKTFFQPTSPVPPSSSPPSSSTRTAATLSHLNQHVQEDHPVDKTATPLSSLPSSPSSSSLSSFIVDTQKMAPKSSPSPLKQQQHQQQHLSKGKLLSSPKQQQKKQSDNDGKTVQALLPLDDEELLRRKRHSRLQPLTINGDNVSADNIEDGYTQFILHHDPDSIGDGIDSLMYVRRKFSSVPRTGDLSYTTWDVYVLVNKLYNREIKNWSQLVGQLGLSDMLGRPQFAQRVKRWMHKYKIDYYFDYLMGTPFDFFSEDEKYSGCLLMGNYQKRKELGDWSMGSGDDSQPLPTPSKRRRRKIVASSSSSLADQAVGDGGDGQSPGGAGGDPSQRPILMAGSRKRMRGDTQQSSLLLVDKQRPEDTDDGEDDDDDDDDMHDLDDDNHMDHDDGSGTDDHEDDDNDNNSGLTPSNQGQQQPTARKGNLEKEIDEDEEDELASTSSTSGSPVLLPASPLLPPADPLSTSPSEHDKTIPSNTTTNALSPSSFSFQGQTPVVAETTAGPSFSDSSPSFHLFDPIPRVAATTNTTNAAPSSSSSPSSPPIPATSVLPSAATMDPSCTSCEQLTSTVTALETKVSMLTQHMDTFISKWKPMMESRCKSLQQQVDTLTDENEKMHSQWTLWRKNMVKGLLEDPFQ